MDAAGPLSPLDALTSVLVAPDADGNSLASLTAHSESGAEFLLFGSRQQLFLLASEGPEPLEARLRAVIAAAKTSSAQFVVVGGLREAVKHQVEEVAFPPDSEYSFGFHHVDGEGTLHGLRGPSCPELKRAAERLRSDPPTTPLDVPAQLRATAERILDRFAEAAEFKKRLDARRPYATWALVAVSVALFGLELWLGGGNEVSVFAHLGGGVGSLLLAGQWWRALSPGFLHGGFLALLISVVGLLYLGPKIEAVLGRRRFLILYLGSIAAGQYASARVTPDLLTLGSWAGLAALTVAAFAIPLRTRLVPAAVKPWLWGAGAVGGVLGAGAMSLWGELPAYFLGFDLLVYSTGLAAGALLVLSGAVTSGVVPLVERDRKGAGSSTVVTPVVTLVAALFTVLAVASMVQALRDGRPWEAVHPQLERVTLDGAGLTAEIPTLLAPGVSKDEHGYRINWFGNRADPVSVEVASRAVPVETKAPVDALTAALQKQARRSPIVDIGVVSGPVSKMELGGRSTMHREYSFFDGARVNEWVAVVGGREVTVRLNSGGELPLEWAKIGERIIASVQTAP